ncbi:hypothetical protein C2869_20405 [Saccharobesus litoralis]|uniref:Uncharacterized protein n=1 Tax=Saccharobesus litoralis TaxID=2172099 RepID=A0A2S0VWQ8_9ALTE|nr:sensor domain-containing phosphodiesterase [Saccharobesus litoralis]AWB68613.1 hypothetical protein C2869_20405 [Saccharobesus litoralis]
MDLNHKFKHLHSGIISLTRETSYAQKERRLKLRNLLKLCANQLDVERVSVWNLTEDNQAICCELLFIKSTTEYQSDLILYKEDHPSYFNAIEQTKLIDAFDAQTDTRTKEFTESYLIPLNIKAMLDAPIFTNGVFKGVLCLEHVGSIRHWDIAELSFAASVADAISLMNEHEAWLKAHQQVEMLEKFDVLTGLESRQFFQQRITRDISRTQRRNCFSSLYVIGIDYFTQVNDLYGAATADTILKAIGEKFNKIAKAYDCALSRIHGDTFALWMPVMLYPGDLNKVVEAIQKELQQPIYLDKQQQFDISCTIGIASDINGDELIDPIRAAEIALKRAKEIERGGYQLFSQSWLEALLEDQNIEKEILSAFDKRQFIPFYQPIICSETGTVKGVEALVRWQHPTQGMVPPFKFLPLISKLGLMNRLGSVMLEAACRDYQRLTEQATTIQWISVNLASEQLYDVNLANEILALLNQYHVPACGLELEIVEELISQDSDIVRNQLEALSNLGVKLSIDDFGTGYSSLSRLKHLPVSKIKIDKTFVDGLPDSYDDQCIVNSIIGLAKGMNLQLVAEGVEVSPQLEWLRQNGVDYFQGYLFSKPLAIDDLLSYLNLNNLQLAVNEQPYKLKLEKNILFIYIKGHVSSDAVLTMFEDITSLVAPILGQSWATVVDVTQWYPGTLELQNAVIKNASVLLEGGLNREAYIVGDSEIANYQIKLMTPCAAGYKREQFNHKQQALAWLKLEGFSLD